MKKKAYIVALGGMLAALSLVLMLLTGLFPFATLALPAMAGILLIAAVFEIGTQWALIIFVAVGLLSLFIAPDKSAALYYILLFGHYPIIKNYIERLHGKTFQWLLKILIFNLCTVGAYYISLKILGITDDIMKYGVVPIIIVLNITFIIYDVAVSRLITVYVYKIRKLLNKQAP